MTYRGGGVSIDKLSLSANKIKTFANQFAAGKIISPANYHSTYNGIPAIV